MHTITLPPAKSSSDDKNATISDFIKKFGEARQITAQELKEDKDWRDMTDSEWGKLLSGFDKYIDTVKAQIKEMESMAIAKYQEAMAKYREEIKKNTPAEEDENHVLTKEEALQNLRNLLKIMRNHWKGEQSSRISPHRCLRMRLEEVLSGKIQVRGLSSF